MAVCFAEFLKGCFMIKQYWVVRVLMVFVVGLGMMGFVGAQVDTETAVSLEASSTSSSTFTNTSIDPIKLAVALPSMPKFTVAAMPTGLLSDRVRDFSSGDDARLGGDIALAVQRYCAVMEQYPSSHEAEGAGKRLAFMMTLLNEDGLNVMETSLPSWEDVSSNLLLTYLSSFYTQRGEQIKGLDAQKEQEYYLKAAEPVFEILKGDVNEFSKAKVLKDFWTQAKLLGDEEQAGIHLLRYMDTAPPSFTTWMIQTLVNGQEPTLENILDVETRDSIRKYYFSEGNSITDIRRSMAYMEKVMALSWDMIENQPWDEPRIFIAKSYLKAAEALEKREEALANLEAFVAETPLSIMRWTVRYDLAINYTEEGRSEEDTRKGFAFFEVLINEGTLDLMDPFINNENIDEWTRGSVMCMLGHAYFGTNRTVEAQAHYDWVLDYYPGVSHPGETAIFSQIQVQERTAPLGDIAHAMQYETFVSQNPSGAYTSKALMRAAEVREKVNDQEGARATYERLINEYPDSDLSREASVRLGELTR